MSYMSKNKRVPQNIQKAAIEIRIFCLQPIVKAEKLQSGLNICTVRKHGEHDEAMQNTPLA